jgi:hypothetical protein
MYPAQLVFSLSSTGGYHSRECITDRLHMLQVVAIMYSSINLLIASFPVNKCATSSPWKSILRQEDVRAYLQHALSQVKSVHCSWFAMGMTKVYTEVCYARWHHPLLTPATFHISNGFILKSCPGVAIHLILIIKLISLQFTSA